MDVLRNYIFIIYVKNWKETATFDLFPYTLSQICSGHLWQIARLNEFVVQPGTNKQTNKQTNMIFLIYLFFSFRTQSILFCRYSNELQPYKYAGYPMLIKTIQVKIILIIIHQ